MRINHIGYLVKRIDKAIDAFQKLGYEIIQDVCNDEYRKVSICFLKKEDYVIELVSASSKDSVVYNLQKKIGNSPYHICYETNDYENDKNNLLKNNYILCSDSHEAIAFQNKKVSFFVHPYLVLRINF